MGLGRFSWRIKKDGPEAVLVKLIQSKELLFTSENTLFTKGLAKLMLSHEPTVKARGLVSGESKDA